MAVCTLRMAELVSGRSAALARYSPISADSFASFLRSSSIFLAVASDVTVAAIAVVVTSPCLGLRFSTLEIALPSVTLPSKVGVAAAFWLVVSWVSVLPASAWLSVCGVATLAVCELLTVEVTDADTDTLAEADALATALVEADALATALVEAEAEATALVEAEADVEALSLIEVDAETEACCSSSLLTVPKTAWSEVAKTSALSTVFSTAVCSLA